MADADTAAQKQPTVLEQINTRLAAIVVADVAPPPKYHASATAVIVGVANDDLKRLFGVMTEVTAEHAALAAQYQELCDKIDESFVGNTRQILIHLANGGLDAEVVKQRDAIDVKVMVAKHLHNVVKSLLFAEMLNQFAPNSRDELHALAISDDWSVVAEKCPSPPDVFEEVFGLGQNELEDILRGGFGSVRGFDGQRRRAMRPDAEAPAEAEPAFVPEAASEA
jgi:hypothetical protein